MNFFEEQDKARQKTGLLVVLFILGVLLLVLAVFIAALLIKYAFFEKGVKPGGPSFHWRDWELLAYVGVTTLVVIFLGSMAKMVALAKGGSYVAESFGGRRLDPAGADPAEKRLINVVEEMAIASGVPVPQVYVLDSEEGINAFAAGHTPNDAAVAVTRGTLRLLNRDELQGVVAHEFSHILNGDMRLNLRILGVLNGILIIATLGYFMLRFGGRGRKSGMAILAAGLSLVIIGYSGVWVGRLIKSAVSRQREFLADASAVQFTRNPSGIAGALKKIGGYALGSRIRPPHAEEASHMFFGNAVRTLFSTHPPLIERIRRIDHGFDGTFPEVKPGATWIGPAGEISHLASEATDTVSAFTTPEATLRRLGNVSPDQLTESAQLLSAIPNDLRQEITSLLGAWAVSYAMLLSKDPEQASSQLLALENAVPVQVVRQTRILARSLEDMDPRLRLPLMDLCLPVLRQMSLNQYRRFSQACHRMIQADQKVTLFEFALEKLITHRLGSAYEPEKGKVVYKSMDSVLSDGIHLLRHLAWLGHPEQQKAEAAFQAGLAKLPLQKGTPPLMPVKRISVQQLSRSMDRLAAAVPRVKKQFIEACAATVLLDNRITVHEAELFRAIGYALDVPLPPFHFDALSGSRTQSTTSPALNGEDGKKANGSETTAP